MHDPVPGQPHIWVSHRPLVSKGMTGPECRLGLHGRLRGHSRRIVTREVASSRPRSTPTMAGRLDRRRIFESLDPVHHESSMMLMLLALVVLKTIPVAGPVAPESDPSTRL